MNNNQRPLRVAGMICLGVVALMGQGFTLLALLGFNDTKSRWDAQHVFRKDLEGHISNLQTEHQEQQDNIEAAKANRTEAIKHWKEADAKYVRITKKILDARETEDLINVKILKYTSESQQQYEMLETLRAENKNLTEENAKLKAKRTRLSGDNLTLENRHGVWEQGTKDLQEHVTKLTNDSHEITKNLTKRQHVLLETNNDIRARQTELSDANTTIDKSKTMKIAMETMQSNATIAERNRDEADKDKQRFDQKKRGLEIEAKQLETRIESQNAKIKALNDTAARLDERIKVLQPQADKLQTSISSAKDQRNDLDRMLKTLEDTKSNHDTLVQEYKDLDSKLSKSRATLGDLQNQTAGLKTDRQNLNESIKTLNNSNNKLKGEQDALERAVATLRTQQTLLSGEDSKKLEKFLTELMGKIVEHVQNKTGNVSDTKDGP